MLQWKLTLCIHLHGLEWFWPVSVDMTLESSSSLFRIYFNHTKNLLSSDMWLGPSSPVPSFQYIFHICPPSHSNIYSRCLVTKCPCTRGIEAHRTSISSSFFDTSPLTSSVLRTIPANSLSDFCSLGTFQNVKVIEKLALCKVCCHLLLVSNFRSI